MSDFGGSDFGSEFVVGHPAMPPAAAAFAPRMPGVRAAATDAAPPSVLAEAGFAARHFVPQGRGGRAAMPTSGDADADPLRAAWAAGHAAGLAEAGTDTGDLAQFCGQLAEAIAARGTADAAAMADAVQALVLTACAQVLAEAVLDDAALARRIGKALAALDGHAGLQLRLHPDRAAALAPLLGAELPIIADDRVELPGFRLTGQGGGIEDGPACWIDAVTRAFGTA